MQYNVMEQGQTRHSKLVNSTMDLHSIQSRNRLYSEDTLNRMLRQVCSVGFIHHPFRGPLSRTLLIPRCHTTQTTFEHSRQLALESNSSGSF